jgi:hypothetical protein
METAKDILDRISTDTTTKGRVKYEDALGAMKEIAELAYKEGYDDGIRRQDWYFFERDKEKTMKELFLQRTVTDKQTNK